MSSKRFELDGRLIWDNVKQKHIMRGPDTCDSVFEFPVCNSDWEMEEFITSINEAWDKLKAIL